MKIFHEILPIFFPSQIPKEILLWIFSAFSDFFSEVDFQIPSEIALMIPLKILLEIKKKCSRISCMDCFRNFLMNALEIRSGVNSEISPNIY